MHWVHIGSLPGLDADGADDLVAVGKYLDHAAEWPVTPGGEILLDDNEVSDLETALGCRPLGTALEEGQVLAFPS